MIFATRYLRARNCNAMSRSQIHLEPRATDSKNHIADSQAAALHRSCVCHNGVNHRIIVAVEDLNPLPSVYKQSSYRTNVAITKALKNPLKN